ncbi:hypothetical protein QVD17_25173 [Tagetes erecta]|uniref:Uncharacterized protein n=1 Tax=Tagetes erecta TaxID=13708 RepID=A0AAD8KFS1_TARER|nr:hypothetical protein QVD17_25173 [Tagetes erecta]
MEDIVSSPETTTAATVTVILTCSVASEMTGNDASVSDFVEQEESSVMDSQENKSTKWTNEKHSLYLKSIEASFVDQLYHSLDMQSCQTQSTNSSDAISTWKNHHDDVHNSSGKFKVLQRGRWSKKSFKKQDSHVKDADIPHFSPGNPWIQHFRNGSLKRLGSTAIPAAQYDIPDSQMDQEPGCSNSIDQHDTVAEVIDQNFVEDTSCSRKRAKTANIDRVVPYFTSAANAIPNSYVFPKQ